MFPLAPSALNSQAFFSVMIIDRVFIVNFSFIDKKCSEKFIDKKIMRKNLSFFYRKIIEKKNDHFFTEK